MRAFKGIMTVAIGLAIALLLCDLTMPRILHFYHAVTSGVLLLLLVLVSVAFRCFFGEFMAGRYFDARRKKKAAATTPTQSGLALNFPPAHTEEFKNLARSTFVQRFPTDIAGNLARILIDPAGPVIRVGERAVFRLGSLDLRVSRTLQRPTENEEFIVPILQMSKGSIVDNLEVTVDGAASSALSSTESQGAMLAALYFLFNTLFSSVPDARRVLEAISDSAVGESSATDREVDDLLQELEALRETAQVERSGSLYAGLLELTRFACKNYYILVAIPAGKSRRVRVVVSRRIQQRTYVPGRWLRLRLALGLENRSFLIPLQSATESSSYHLQADAPAGMYVFDALLHPITVETERQLARQRRLRSDRPLAVVSDTVGLDYVHAYIRDLEGHLSDLVTNASGNNNNQYERQMALGLDVEFREKPPGILLAVMLLSIFLLGLTLAVGHFHDDLFPSVARTTNAATQATANPAAASPTGSNTTSTACVDSSQRKSNQGATTATTPCDNDETDNNNLGLLFGIPALLAGWLASRVGDDVLRRISFPTAILCLWFVVNACFAVFLAGFKTLQTHATSLGLGEAQVTHVTWLLLALSAGTHAAISVVMWLNRTVRYTRRLRLGAQCVDV